MEYLLKKHNEPIFPEPGQRQNQFRYSILCLKDQIKFFDNNLLNLNLKRTSLLSQKRVQKNTSGFSQKGTKISVPGRKVP